MEELKTQPIYLLSDSQLLFAKNSAGAFYLRPILGHLPQGTVKAAYIGASNGDVPEFYEIFVAGMKNLDITDCSMVSAAYTEADRQNLSGADLILLAGGDVLKGYQVMQHTGMAETIQERYTKGAVLIGVSAGAVQLGWQASAPAGEEDGIAKTGERQHLLKLVPFLVDVHDEENEWASLQETIRLSDSMKRGIGIPFGTGAIYHPDQTVEALRSPIREYYLKDGALNTSEILPVKEE